MKTKKKRKIKVNADKLSKFLSWIYAEFGTFALEWWRLKGQKLCMEDWMKNYDQKD